MNRKCEDLHLSKAAHFLVTPAAHVKKAKQSKLCFSAVPPDYRAASSLRLQDSWNQLFRNRQSSHGWPLLSYKGISVFNKKFKKKKKKTPLNCHLTVVEGLSTWMILGAMLRAYWHTGSVSGLPAAQWCKRKCCRGSLRWPRKSSAAIWHQWRNFMASAASGKPWPSLRTHHTPDTICSKYFHQTDNTGSSKLAQTDSKAVSTKQLWLH